ncbi:MAG: antibiotic biosynthesis monooxygenase [Methanosphaera sp.]|uniref:putative quinol monooxygenase n=1 Tax=Methanosphaera sp. ISO3-F5 TaxID=1452353 RepID=UPI002B25F846|nr:putative quinol monooxygenase [Methanosphaera sp. ISO3-F5]MBR0472469.1 antibiotic biosynthesis monooxygenase [Methanosphaera sp.]WQH64203.1 putative quinol monooxygenase [Methanosphaera sp. ISO3-F5]
MIIVNATFEPKEGKLDEILEKAEPLINASKTHEGNISYNLYKNVQDNSLTFVEQWQSSEALQKHMKTEEFLLFGQETKDLFAKDLEIKIYTAELLTDESAAK